MKFKLPLFYQYLLSYSVLLFVPIAVVGLLGYYHFADVLRNQVLHSNRNDIVQIGESMDIKLKEMANIAAQISGNNSLARYNIQDPNLIYNSIKQLNYSGANQFFRDVLFYPRGSRYIYSAESSYRLQDYYDLNTYSGWTFEQFNLDLNRAATPAWRTAEPVKSLSQHPNSMITYIAPIPVGSPVPYATVVFQIMERDVQDMLRSVDLYQNGNAFILDEKGRVMTSLTNTSFLGSDEFVALLDRLQDDGGDQLVEFDGESYHLTHLKSKSSGWVYVTMVPERELLKPVKAFPF